MIEEKNVQSAIPDDTVTIADPGKAEPGRDIFAGEPKKDIKSDGLPVQLPEPAREQKEISSVIIGTLTSSSASSSTSVSESSLSSSDSSKGIEESSSVASETMETAKPKAAGPLGEAELEAQKVANELYPEAAEK